MLGPARYFFRRHWKKGAAVGAASYGVNYFVQKYRSKCIQIHYQNAAAEMGDRVITQGWKPTNYTVIIDTKSGNRNAKGEYTKYVAPIFLVSGLKIDVVETKEPGQMKETALALDTSNMDGVVIVGDDGSIQEFVTGWMRRTDGAQIRNVAVGVVPMGKRNTLGEAIIPTSTTKRIDNICKSAFTIAQGKTEFVDTLCVTASNGKSVYCMGYLGWGQIASLVKGTYNKYSGLSRFRGQYQELKQMLLSGLPNHNCYIAFRSNSFESWTVKEINFNSLFLASVPKVNGITLDIRMDRSYNDGMASLSIVSATSILGLVKSWFFVNIYPLSDLLATEIHEVKEFTIASSEESLLLDSPTDLFVSSNTQHSQTNIISKLPFGKKDVSSDSDIIEVNSSTTDDNYDAADLNVPLLLDGESFDSFSLRVDVEPQNLLMFTWNGVAY